MMADAIAVAAVMNQPKQGSGVQAFGKKGERSWTTGPCGCCTDCKQSCCMLFCPCFMQILMARRMKESCWVPFVVPMGMMALRVRMRSKLDIEGSVCGDCCCTLFCGPFSACQMYRELDAVGVPDFPCFGGGIRDAAALAQD